ncbi:MAG: hypothetical protein QNJ97_21415 [Myxococcota bacterium]|nr:hypothetical protein [Myxococcota bacterium]
MRRYFFLCMIVATAVSACGSEADSDPGTETDTSDTETETDMDTSTGDTETETDMDTDSGDTDTETETDMDTDSDTDTEATCDPGFSWTYHGLGSYVSLNFIEPLPDGALYASGNFSGIAKFYTEPEVVEVETSQNSNGGYEPNAFFTYLDASGVISWVVTLPTQVRLSRGATTPEGSLLIAGLVYGPVTFGQGSNAVELVPVDDNDMFLAQYSQNGTLEWAKLASRDGENCSPNKVHVSATGIYLRGFLEGTCVIGTGAAAVVLDQPDSGYFIARFGLDGTLEWALPQDGRPAFRDEAILMVGEFVGEITLGEGADQVTLTGTPDVASTYLARYLPDGRLDWARVAGENLYRVYAEVLADNTISAYGGYAGADAKLGDGDDEMLLPNTAKGIFVARFATDGGLTAGGQAVSSDQLYTPHFNFASCDDGTIYVNGYFRGDAQFGFGPDQVNLSSPENTQIGFLAKYQSDSSLAWVQETYSDINDLSTNCAGKITLVGTDYSQSWGIGTPNAVVATFEASGELAWETDRWQYDRERGLLVEMLGDGSIITAIEQKAVSTVAIHLIAAADDGTILWDKPLVKGGISQETGASGFDHLFYGPDPVCEPADVSLYAYDKGIAEFIGTLWSRALVWLQEDCITECIDMGDNDECLEASCITTAGATISYRYTLKQITESWFYKKTIATEWIIVEPPEGETSWKRIEIQYAYEDDGGGVDDPPNAHETYTASWEGSVDPALPSDYTVHAQHDSDLSDHYWIHYWIWSHEGMDLSIDHLGAYFSSVHERVTINGDVIEARSGANFGIEGWINDNCMGQIHHLTWEIIGPCGG